MCNFECKRMLLPILPRRKAKWGRSCTKRDVWSSCLEHRLLASCAPYTEPKGVSFVIGCSALAGLY